MAVWRKGYCYQWQGNDWVELDPKTNSDKYMVALEDLLEHAPDGAFNNLFCLNLIAQKAFVKYLQALEITLSELTENGQTKLGSIKSQNYSAGKAGFKINYNGDVEFNNGIFRGKLEAATGTFKGELQAATGTFAGELQAATIIANTISIGGTVVEGTNYVIRRNNAEIRLSNSSITNMKEIRTAAQGKVKLRLRFENPGGGGQSTYGGQYIILVNGTPDTGPVSWNNITTFNSDFIHPRDITLPNSINTIAIGLLTPSINQTAVNTTFEILCRDDPKFLALLG
jgi:hypothetical protein